MQDSGLPLIRDNEGVEARVTSLIWGTPQIHCHFIIEGNWLVRFAQMARDRGVRLETASFFSATEAAGNRNPFSTRQHPRHCGPGTFPCLVRTWGRPLILDHCPRGFKTWELVEGA